MLKGFMTLRANLISFFKIFWDFVTEVRQTHGLKWTHSSVDVFEAVHVLESAVQIVAVTLNWLSVWKHIKALCLHAAVVLLLLSRRVCRVRAALLSHANLRIEALQCRGVGRLLQLPAALSLLLHASSTPPLWWIPSVCQQPSAP